VPISAAYFVPVEDASALKAHDNHNVDCRRRQTRHRESKKYNQKLKMKSPLIGATESRIMREEARVRLENLHGKDYESLEMLGLRRSQQKEFATGWR
jgi:hypothetical protein